MIREINDPNYTAHIYYLSTPLLHAPLPANNRITLRHTKFCLTQRGYLNKIDNKHDFQVAEDAHTTNNT